MEMGNTNRSVAPAPGDDLDPTSPSAAAAPTIAAANPLPPGAAPAAAAAGAAGEPVMGASVPLPPLSRRGGQEGTEMATIGTSYPPAAAAAAAAAAGEPAHTQVLMPGNGHANGLNGNGNGHGHGTNGHHQKGDLKFDANGTSSHAVKELTPAQLLERAQRWSAMGVTAAQQEQVDSLFDASKPHDTTHAIMDGLTDLQIEYFVECVTPAKMGILQRKEMRAGLRAEASGATLSWRDLSFTDKKGQFKRFQNCHGVLKPGQMLCVIGGADAGISSLLMSLARNHPKHAGETHGDLRLDGQLPDANYLRRVGFVNKEDVNIPVLTVRETLMFSARLRMSPKFSDKVKRIHVEALMKMIALRHRADVIHGDAVLRGISGGEKRRLSLATELIAQHQVNIWDLPTNGLDSHSAYDVMHMYKQIGAQTGQSLIAALVQPAPELLALFDHVLLMSAGEPVYLGPTQDAAPYLQALGYHIPQEKAVPDWLQEVTVDPHKFIASLEPGKADADPQFISDVLNGRKVVPRVTQDDARKHLLTNYAASKFAAQTQAQLAQVSPPAGAPQLDPNDPIANSGYMASPWRQVSLCIERQATTVLRDKGLLWGSLLKNAVVALIAGSLFWQIGYGQRDGRIRFGLVFFSLMFNTMTSIQLIPNVMEQRHVMYLHASSGYFRRINFYIAYMLLEIPQSIMHCFAYMFVMYPMVGLRGGIDSPEFGYFALIIIGSNLAGKAWALFLAAVCSTEESAHALAPLTVMLMATLNGFMVPYSQIPNGWIWVYYLSFLTYALRGAMKNEMIGLTFHCNPEEFIPPTSDPTLYLPAPAGYGGHQACSITTGINALDQYDMGSVTPDGFYSDDKWAMFGNLMIFLVAINILAVMALHLDHRPGDTSVFAADQQKKTKAAADKAAAANGNGHALANGHGEDRKEAAAAANNGGAIAVSVAPATPAADAFSTGLRSQAMQLSWFNLCYEVDVPKKGAIDAHLAVKKAADGKDEKNHGNGNGNGHGDANGNGHNGNGNGDKKDKEPEAPSAGLCAGTDSVQLLKNVFGFCEPGNMLALLGASGAGKSTLLDVLANKKTSGRISGELLINGKPRDETFSLVSGYVEQLDSLHQTSTVREALAFSARLRLPPDTPEHVRKERVDAALEMLDLTPIADRVIGSVESGGISPELRKKTTIGVELVIAPSILFLDEPTTGLDALAAFNVIKCVKKLARHISVICTVHQPSQEIVEQFDSLLLLKRGGDVVYNGPLKALVAYFGKKGYGECEPDRNIADFALEVSGKAKSKGVDAQLGGSNEKDMADVFLESDEVKPIQQRLQAMGHDLAHPRGHKIPLNHLGCASVFGCGGCDGGVPPANGFWVQWQWLLERNVKGLLRNRGALISRMTSGVFTAIIFGTFFYQLRHDQLSASNRVALCFITAIMPIGSAGRLIPVLVNARPVFFRELQSKTYTSFAYWFARFCAEVPAVLAEGILYSVVLYFITNLRTDDNGIHFAYFLFLYWITRLLGFQWTETLSQSLHTQEAATAAASVYMNLAMIFAGFFIPRNSMPIGWRWANYISFFRYPISFLTNNELRDLELSCPDHRGALPLSVYNETDPSAVYACTQTSASVTDACIKYICPLTSGNSMLAQFDMADDSSGEQFGITVVFLAGFGILSFLTLSYVQHIKR